MEKIGTIFSFDQTQFDVIVIILSLDLEENGSNNKKRKCKTNVLLDLMCDSEMHDEDSYEIYFERKNYLHLKKMLNEVFETLDWGKVTKITEALNLKLNSSTELYNELEFYCLLLEAHWRSELKKKKI
jgi:hypothetical protein